jgi:hypothetical protein
VGPNIILPPLAAKDCHNIGWMVESLVKSSVTGNPEIVKQDTRVPSLPLQLQFQGPMLEPEIVDAVPVVQSPVVGALETWTAVAGPHWLEARLSGQAADDIRRRIEDTT